MSWSRISRRDFAWRIDAEGNYTLKDEFKPKTTETNMTFQYDAHKETPGSSNISAIYWKDNFNNTFDVVVGFTHGGFAGYRNVRKSVLDEFKNAYSVGSYYNRYVKHHHTGFSVYGVNSKPVTVANTLQPKAHNYLVTYTSDGTVTVNATSVEDAVEQVKKKISGAKPVKVEVTL